MSMLVQRQEVLVQPKMHDGEERSAWRSRYMAAMKALNECLLALPSITLPKPPEAPEWVYSPNVIVMRTESEDYAPSFQFGADSQPLPTVLTVNFRLARRYPEGNGLPWGGRDVSRLVWWVRVHPDLEVAPVDLLGTDREPELIDLATGPNPRYL